MFGLWGRRQRWCPLILVQEPLTRRVLQCVKCVLPKGRSDAAPRASRLSPGQRVQVKSNCPFHPAPQRAASDLGGTKQRLCPLIYGANTADAPRLERFKDASSQGGGRTRPGVLTHLIPSQRGAGSEVGAHVHPRNRGPRQTSGGPSDDCAPKCMVQELLTPRALSRSKLRPPKREVGRGPACFALVTGPRGTRTNALIAARLGL